MLIRAAACESDADAHALVDSVRSATIADDIKGGRWTVTARVSDAVSQAALELSAGLDIATGSPVSRRINGAELPGGVFNLNGRDIAAETLGPPLR
jgi:hypothetical protein